MPHAAKSLTVSLPVLHPVAQPDKHIVPPDKPATKIAVPQREKAQSTGADNPSHSTIPVIKLTRKPEMIGMLPNVVQIAQGMSGEVTFKLLITREGIVKSVNTVHSTLPREIEGQLAYELYRKDYRPSEENGKAVDGELIVHLNMDAVAPTPDNFPVIRQ